MTKAILSLMILLIAPAGTPAQSSEDSWDNLRQLRPGQRITVVDMKLNSRQGSFTGSRAGHGTQRFLTWLGNRCSFNRFRGAATEAGIRFETETRLIYAMDSLHEQSHAACSGVCRAAEVPCRPIDRHCMHECQTAVALR